jgi:hypothetical protein
MRDRSNLNREAIYLLEAGQRSPTENVLAALLEGIRLVFDENGSPAAILMRGTRMNLSGAE